VCDVWRVVAVLWVELRCVALSVEVLAETNRNSLALAMPRIKATYVASPAEQPTCVETGLKAHMLLQTRSQSNLGKANPPSRCGGSEPPSDTMFRGPPRVFTPNSILIRSAVFAQRSQAEPHDRQTDRQATDRHREYR